MHKIHVTAYYQQSLDRVFATISDHCHFLTGGGLSCRLIKPGSQDINGVGAIRAVKTDKYTLTEVITDFVENESFDYLIKNVEPAIAMKHHNGWMQFMQVDDKVRVDWHSHFTITTPVVGHLIGWFVKKQIEKSFAKRLDYFKETT